MSFVSKIVKNRSTPIHLIRCETSDGLPCHFFIMAESTKISRLSNIDPEVDALDLNEYGKILTSGWGHIPSNDTISYLKEAFDFDATTLL